MVSTQVVDNQAKPGRPKKVFAKVAHLYAGVDLIGSKTSIHSRDAEIEVTPIGLRMISKKTKRIILIPWANIKGTELLPNDVEE